jgi:signal recognition particle subunit SRP54
MNSGFFSKSLRDIVLALSSKRRTSRVIDERLQELRKLLIQSDVSVGFAKNFVERIKIDLLSADKNVDIGEIFARRLQTALTAKKEIPILSGRILIVGLNGAGKTTTVGKMAKRCSQDGGGGVGIVAADLTRPGAVEQVKILGETAGADVYAEPNTALRDLLKGGKEWSHSYHTVFFDIAGRQDTETRLMSEIAEIAQIIRPNLILYVCDGSGGQQLAKASAEFAGAVKIDGIVLTKIDGDCVGGGVLGLIHETSAPVLYLGTGEKIEDLEVFCPVKMSRRILGKGGFEELLSKIEGEKNELFGWDLKKTMDLNDFLESAKFMKRLGSVHQVARWAGFEQGEEFQSSFEDIRFSQIEALVNSMTPEERKSPELFSNTDRIQRVSQGAGIDSSTTLEFLGRFWRMREILRD